MKKFRTITLLLVSLIGSQSSNISAQQNRLDDSILKNLPNDATQILIVHDILPLIKSALQHEQLQDVFSKQMATAFGKGVDLNEIWEQVEQNKAFIPDRIAVTAQDGAMQNIGEVHQLIVLMLLAQSAVSVDEIETDLEKVHGLLTKLLSGFKLPDLTVLIHFREQQALDQAFDTVQNLMVSQLSTLVDKDEKNTVSISGKVSDLYPEFALRLLLEQLGMADDGDSASARQIAKACANIALKLQVERIDGALRITVGDEPAKRGIPAEALGEMYRRGDTEIIFGKYDLTGLKTALEGCQQFIQAFEGTKTHDALEKIDTNDIRSSVNGMIRTISRVNLRSTFRIHSEPAKVIADVEGLGGPSIPSLHDSPLLTLIPADSTFAWASNVATAGRRFSDGVLYFENNLSVDVGDLGLGVKTYELNADWLEPVLKKANFHWEEFDGDCRSHFFFVDDLFVFSTSPRLSREMLAAKKSGKHLQVAQDTVDIGLISGKTLGDTYQYSGKLASEVYAQIPGTRSVARQLDSLGTVVGGLCSLMNETRWRTLQDHSLTRTRWEIEFKK